MYSQNDGRSLTARTIDYPKTGAAQSREEIATDQTVRKILLQKYPAQPRREIAPDHTSKPNAILGLTIATLKLHHQSEEVGGLVRQSPGMGTLCDQTPAQPHKNDCAKSCAFLLEAASLTETFSLECCRGTRRDTIKLHLN